MKKHLPYIIILGILAYFIWSNRQSNISSKLFIAKIESMELEYKSKLDSLNSKITILRDSINQEKQITSRIIKESKNLDEQAYTYRNKYNQLKKENPKTKDEIIENYKKRDIALLTENKKLQKSNKKKDTAIAIQYKTITKLETIICM
jgi:hypothetical protein